MNILLTGSDGFIGSHLFHQLKEEHDVIGFDIKNGHDILNSELPKDIDLVIHLAGLSGVKDSLTRPTEYWKTNVIGTQRLFEHYENTRIIYASSSTAHEPWKNPYAMSKYSMEQLFHINSLGLRFTTAYGPGGREQMLIPKILRNDIQWINTNHKRDFIHVNDLIDAVHMLISERHINGIIDIGSGTSHQITDLMKHFGIDFDGKIGGENERLDNKANIELLTKYNWKPHYNLYDYIEENRSVN